MTQRRWSSVFAHLRRRPAFDRVHGGGRPRPPLGFVVSRWDALMDRALALATDPQSPRGVNPRVGCVIVDASGRVVGEGWHEGAGTPHAEVVALGNAGPSARGGTAIVTLEPCHHHGRTGPCTQALIEAGITRVVFGQIDPTDVAGGGAEFLRSVGVEVIGGIRAQNAEQVNREWSIAAARGRPFVTAKCAISLDGRVAGPGGVRVRLTGDAANRYVHDLRSRVQAVIVGTQTVIDDDPELTVRHAPVPITGQPLRVVVGFRKLPSTARVLDPSAPHLLIHTHDPLVVLADLDAAGARHVLVEGGPTVLRAFLEAGLIDEFIWLIAGVWLGAGPRALPEGMRLERSVEVVQSEALGQDVLVRARCEGRVA